MNGDDVKTVTCNITRDQPTNLEQKYIHYYPHWAVALVPLYMKKLPIDSANSHGKLKIRGHNLLK